jgi:hypothetical protein
MPTMSPDSYVLAVFVALFAFALFRRFRSLFGRQLLQPARLKTRIAVLSLVALLLAMRGLHSTNLAAAGVGGLIAGAALAYLGLRLTRFDAMPGGIFYTPNGYIGAILSALLLGRIVYRMQVLYPVMHAAQTETGNPFAGFQRSPLTVALFGIVIGYYLAYCAGLLIRGAAIGASSGQSVERASPPSGP